MIDDLRGEFFHTLDDKNRISIPRQFRTRLMEEENGKVVITRGLEGCLWIYPSSYYFSEVVSQMKKFSLFDEKAQRFFNAFGSGAHDTLDKTGRVLLPQTLMKYAGIEKEIVVIGYLTRIQVWSLARWNQHQETINAEANKIANEMLRFFPGGESSSEGGLPN